MIKKLKKLYSIWQSDLIVYLFLKVKLFKGIKIKGVYSTVLMEDGEVRELCWFNRANNLLEEFQDEKMYVITKLVEQKNEDRYVVYDKVTGQYLEDIDTLITENPDKVHTFRIKKSNTARFIWGNLI